MPLDNQRPITNNFNRNTEKDVENRISAYDLNKDEKVQVWQAVNDRNKNIDAERKDYRENWETRFNNEVDRLKGNQRPGLQLNLGNRQLPNEMQTRRLAQRNVQANHIAKVKGYEHEADKKINNVLDQAKERGRGPERQQNRSLTQEFNRQNDLDR